MEDNTTNLKEASSEIKKQLIIDITIKDFLKEIAKWGKFLSIVGFVL
jgi:hypothetical protein